MIISPIQTDHVLRSLPSGYSRSLNSRRRALVVMLFTFAVLCWSQDGLQIAHAQEEKARPTTELGTKATLKDLLLKPRQANRAGINSSADSELSSLPIQALNAAIPDKQFLRHSLKTGLIHLRPGSAQLHFFRAIQAYKNTPPEKRKAWESFLMDEASEKATADSLKKVIDPLEPVLAELDRFSRCEDFQFDLRLRDLPFDKRMTANLNEIQDSRDLARVLRYRALQFIRQGDFGNAMESIRIGIRLSQFVQQGETLVEQLVSIAIRGMMYDCILEAIQTDGCPNLYYHLVAVELNIEPLARAVEFEGIALRNYPLFREAETAGWNEETWNEKWGEVFDVLVASGMFGKPENATATKAIGMAFLAGQTKQSRQNLIKAGFPAEKVEAMLPQQVVAIDTAREMEKLVVFMQVTPHLSHKESQLAWDELMSMINARSRPKNVYELFFQAMLPALEQVFVAHHRMIARKNMILTVESIREFAARQGQLPKDLNELNRPTAILDPYRNQPLDYVLETIDGEKIATVSFPSITPLESRAVRFKIKK